MRVRLFENQVILPSSPKWRYCVVSISSFGRVHHVPSFSKWVKEKWRVRSQRQQHGLESKKPVSWNGFLSPCVYLHGESEVIHLARRALTSRESPGASFKAQMGTGTITPACRPEYEYLLVKGTVFWATAFSTLSWADRREILCREGIPFQNKIEQPGLPL